MLFGWDDEVWKVFIQGGFGFLSAAFATYLTFKLNSISRKQLENSAKIDNAATKAEVAVKRVDEVDARQTAHLERQDLKLDTIVKQGNGLIEEVKQKAHKEGHASGEKAALTKLGMEPKRTTDLE